MVSVTSLGLVLIGIAGSTLNVALPAVVRHFDAGPLESGWVLLAYLLVNTATLVFFGRVADLLGRREIYLAGFALFTIASLLAGFSPNVWFLVAMRVLQAIGASAILANGTVIITDAFPPERLSQGMGVYIGTLSVAQLAGPTLGGLIADAAGWQWIFWVNVPAGIIAVIWGALTLRKMPRGPRQPVDILGNALVFAALSAVLVALSEAGSRGLTSPVVLTGVVLFVLLLPLIAVVERRATHPVLNMRLFGGRMLACANLASFCNSLARAALILVVALYFQAARGGRVHGRAQRAARACGHGAGLADRGHAGTQDLALLPVDRRLALQRLWARHPGVDGRSRDAVLDHRGGVVPGRVR